MNRNDKVTGTYHGVKFSGTVKSVTLRFGEAYYEIEFTAPVVIYGSERTGVCMYAVNGDDFVKKL